MFRNLKRPLQSSASVGLDFDALLEAQNQIAGQSSNSAKDTYQAGADLLRQAEQSGFSDKSLLQEAGQLFSQVIQQHPAYVEAYLGMAQLFLKVDQKPKAHEYFTQAQRLQPQHAEVRRLTAVFMDLKAPQMSEEEKAADKAQALTEWLVQPKQLQSAHDYDHAYEMLEKFLQAFVRSLSLHEQAPIQASLKAEAVAELKARSQELESIERHILKTLTALEAEFNIESLQTKIWPIQVLLRKYHRAIKDSQTYQDVQAQIVKATQHVRKTYQNLVFSPSPEEVKAFEQELEQLLDICDHVADQLDDLEKRQLRQEELKRQYDKLVLMVESLSEQLDSLIEEC